MRPCVFQNIAISVRAWLSARIYYSVKNGGKRAVGGTYGN